MTRVADKTPHLTRHISAGDLIRKHLDHNSEYRDLVAHGKMIPSSASVGIVAKHLTQLRPRPRTILLDGLPRTAEQAHLWFETTGAHPTAIIQLQIDDEVAVKKSAGRRICSGCAAIYNLAHIETPHGAMPPILPKKDGVCDKCGSRLVARSDDSEEVMRKRLKLHYEMENDLLKYYGAARNPDGSTGIPILKFPVTTGLKQLPEFLSLVNDLQST